MRREQENKRKNEKRTREEEKGKITLSIISCSRGVDVMAGSEEEASNKFEID